MSSRILIDTAKVNLGLIVQRVQNRGALHKVMGVAGARAVKDHFAKNADWQKNKFGRPAQFWKRMYRATRSEASQIYAAVIMPSEVAQRFYGGPIKPTGGKTYLTIPAHASAYRRSAQSFENLALVIFPNPKGKAEGMLVRRRRVKRKSVQEVMYWLVRGVNQAGDARVMPTDKELGDAIIPEVESYLLRNGGARTDST